VRESLSGYRFVITQVADAAEFMEMLQEFASLRARMVLVVPPAPEITIPSSIVRSVEIVSLVNPCNGRGVRNVIPDEIETGRIGTRYLLDRGHRRIVHLMPHRQSPAIVHRARGYTLTMREHHLRSAIVRDWTPAGLCQQIDRLQATAVFCHNDWLALSAMRCLNQAGLRVPQDMSVLGVDDSPTFTSLCSDITTLHYPAESIAAAIAGLLAGKRLAQVASAAIVERSTVASLGR
jgi:LacI family transcriptional regulator